MISLKGATMKDFVKQATNTAKIGLWWPRCATKHCLMSHSTPRLIALSLCSPSLHLACLSQPAPSGGVGGVGGWWWWWWWWWWGGVLRQALSGSSLTLWRVHCRSLGSSYRSRRQRLHSHVWSPTHPFCSGMYQLELGYALISS